MYQEIVATLLAFVLSSQGAWFAAFACAVLIAGSWLHRAWEKRKRKPPIKFLLKQFLDFKRENSVLSLEIKVENKGKRAIKVGGYIQSKLSNEKFGLTLTDYARNPVSPENLEGIRPGARFYLLGSLQRKSTGKGLSISDFQEHFSSFILVLKIDGAEHQFEYSERRVRAELQRIMRDLPSKNDTIYRKDDFYVSPPVYLPNTPNVPKDS